MTKFEWPQSVRMLRRPTRDRQFHLFGLPKALERVRQAAERDGRMRFTSLWHHVYNIEALGNVYHSLKRDAAPGVDGETWRHYGQELEDKIIQRVTTTVLNAIYETDFLGFSYVFRPGRSPNDAVNVLNAAVMTRKVSWVLDADIRGYFDAIAHEWLVKFIEHRVVDKRVLRHIKKWLNAGVLEEGARVVGEEGVSQGGSISPLLVNVYFTTPSTSMRTT